jgi:hypothetical protein
MTARCGRDWEDPALHHDVGQIASLTPFHPPNHIPHSSFLYHPHPRPSQWHQSAATSA